jgi:tetratricopeptide (TPR) repeat protein
MLPTLCVVAAGMLFLQPANAQHEHGGGGADGVPIYTTLGNHGHEISTDSPEAQVFFNQGLKLQYAFNHAEAIRSYEKALSYDGECAMCWWGIALAYGPNINAPMDEESGRKAFEAINNAKGLSSGATATERGLIDALANRYAADPLSERAPLNAAYADAMAKQAAAFPDDADVQTLYAASLMNKNPWNYWSGGYGDRKPNPGTPEALASLERALELDRHNPGACHYYIHAVEAAYPERAVECAERLAGLMPGAGHIVHMPGHIYIRVGRYRDAVTANDHAVHTDEEFIADQSPMGLYPMAYYPHNYHFMSFAATLAGMSEKATMAAEAVAPKVPTDIALVAIFIQNAVVLPQLTAVTFGEWERVLEYPLPDERLGLATAGAHYARGTAFAALGNAKSAADEAALLDEVAKEFDPTGENAVFRIAKLALAGEMALRSGDAESAVESFQAAAELEDGMLYEEPPLWYYPVRHSLGKALLAAERPADAEAAYRYDLERFPGNGWSLFGLAQSLDEQGKEADAAKVRAEFEKAWEHADVTLTSSRF